MKKIMISIHPEWMEKIIRRKKKIEVRTTVPQDLPCEAYFYVTKGGKQLYSFRKSGIHKLNGMVVAKFRLTASTIYPLPVEEHEYAVSNGTDQDGLLALSCLNFKQLEAYLGWGYGYAYHINCLEVFDEPKPLKDFGLKRAPQSWCHIKKGA